MSQILIVNYDGLSDEADITTAGGAPDPFDDGFTNGTVTVKADNAISFDYGSFRPRSNAMRFTGDGTGNSAARGWDATLGSQDIVAFLCPFRVDTLPSALKTIAVWYDTATQVNAQLRLNDSGQLQVRAKFSQIAISSTGLIEVDTNYWLGAKVKGGVSDGYIEAKVWDASGTLLETVGNQTANKDTRADHDQLNFGQVEGSANWVSWFGEMRVDDADYPSLPSFATTVTQVTSISPT